MMITVGNKAIYNKRIFILFYESKHFLSMNSKIFVLTKIKNKVAVISITLEAYCIGYKC